MVINDIFQYLVLSAVLVFAIPGTLFKGVFTAVAITCGAVIVSIAGVESIAVGDAALNVTLTGMDAMSGLFALMVAISSVACAVYAVGYLPRHDQGKSNTEMGLHFAAMIVLFYAMIGILRADEMYGFLFWWEMMTLSSFILVMFDGQKKEVLHAAVGYLVMMHVGFFTLLAGFAISSDGEAFFSGQGLTLPVFLLLLVGFGMKAGLVPLHMWMPVAHPAAPAHVSAIMSGVMIKMGIYGIVRMVMALTPEALFTAGVLLFSVGAVTAIYGIARAAVQTDIKRLLAYSSIENIGIICLGIGVGTVGRSMGSDFVTYTGFGGALLQMLAHSNYKTLLFLGAGSVVDATHLRGMNRFGGLLKRMPITGVLFLAATLAVCLVPGMVGFMAEFVLLEGMFSMIADGSLIVMSVVGIVVLALVGGLTVMTFTKAFGITFLGNPRSCAARDAREVNIVMLVAQMLPLAGIVAGSILYPYIVLENADVLFGARYYAQPMIDTMITVELIMVGVAMLTGGLVYLKVWLNRRAKVAVESRPTWGCAFTVPSKKMQYTASAYNRELQTMLWEGSAKRQTTELSEDDIFPTQNSFEVARKRSDSRSSKVVTRWVVYQLRRWTARLALFQTGKTNHYVLQALLLLVLILVLSLCGVL